MNITTKYETGDIVYAVHPCRLIGGKVIINGRESDRNYSPDHWQTYGDDIYIVSPHEVRNVTVFCNGKSAADIRYELSGGTVRREKDVSASFDDAAGYAVRLYEQSAGKSDRPGESGRTEILKENVCGKLQQALKAVLSSDQLERFQEEFMKATQGLVFRET